MCIYLEEAEAADVEVVAIGLASAVVLPLAVVLHPHHIVVHVAHHRQDHREVHPGAESVVRRLLIALDLRLAARDADLPHEATRHLPDGKEHAGIDRGPLIMTAGGYPGILHDPVLPVTNRAHQRPGSEQGHRHVPRHAGDAALLHDSRAGIKKRKRSPSSSRSRSRSKAERGRRRVTRSPSDSPVRRERSPKE
ncbi:hypothetical protein ACJBU6_02117 [Exserohilum turcicum]